MRSRRLTLFATTTLTLGLSGRALAQTVAPFSAPQTYVSSGNPDGPSTYWSASGDFNGDGYIDLAAPDIRSLNNILGFSVAFGRAGGGFDAPVTRTVGTSSVSCAPVTSTTTAART